VCDHGCREPTGSIFSGLVLRQLIFSPWRRRICGSSGVTASGLRIWMTLWGLENQLVSKWVYAASEHPPALRSVFSLGGPRCNFIPIMFND